MKNRKFTTSCLAGAFVALLVASAWSSPPGIDEDADRILRDMGEYLKTAEELSVEAQHPVCKTELK